MPGEQHGSIAPSCFWYDRSFLLRGCCGFLPCHTLSCRRNGRYSSSGGLSFGLRKQQNTFHTAFTGVSLPVHASLTTASSLQARDTGKTNAAGTQANTQFFVSDVDDPERPTPGFDPIADAIQAIKNGEFVVVVDDEDRENEGDLIIAADAMTPEKMAFLVRHTSGLVCIGMTGERLDALELPPMVQHGNNESMRTAFTISVDVMKGTSTGISAADRCATVRALADPTTQPDDFRRPGHLFPLRAREGGVLTRPGHTEASVDLARLAGRDPSGVLCELMDHTTGTMLRYKECCEFAAKHGLKYISIADLIRYRKKRQPLIKRTASARLPTTYGEFQVVSYKSIFDNVEYAALVCGEIGEGMDVLVRVHSECVTGDLFTSLRCDCGPQLHLAMKKVQKAGRGVVVYLRGHEGRGIGLGYKLRAYNLQDEGRDTVDANLDLGFPADSRDYAIGAQILRDLGVRTVKLMTNNPAKFLGLKGYGLAVTKRVPLLTPVNVENARYMETKRTRMGHMVGLGPELDDSESDGTELDVSDALDPMVYETPMDDGHQTIEPPGTSTGACRILYDLPDRAYKVQAETADAGRLPKRHIAERYALLKHGRQRQERGE
eukprot:jgi/Mesvir1/19916/Mv13187-RA.1